MKKIFILFTCIIFIGVSYLAIEGNEMQVITTEIEISAPPSKVWGILTNINQWQEWSPIIAYSQGEASLGSKLNITMVGKGDNDGPKYNPKIIVLNEPNTFRWSAQMLTGFVFTNDKIFKLEATNTGTHLIHTETFKGLLAPIFRSTMKKGVPPMLNSMNKALKEQAEN